MSRKATIILTVRNEREYISKIVNSINLQTVDQNEYEVIISDGCSNDGTLEIVKHYLQVHSNYKVIHNKNKIVSTGFNLALNQAQGEIIVRVDGHSELPSDYLKKCFELIKNKDVEIVGGVIDTIADGRIGEAISIAQSTYFGVGNVKFRNIGRIKSGYVNTLAFGAHKRELFYDIGAYDEEMICNQDDEFNFRAIKAGKRIWMDPSIKTKYHSRSNYRQLFKQYFNYGCYKVRGIQKRGKVISIRHLIPSTFIISLIGTLIHGYFQHLPWLSYSVLSIYFIINIIASIIVSQKASYIPFVFLAFCTLHLGYGLGFIWGLIRFIWKWRDKTLRDDHFNRKQFIANSPVVSL